MIRIDEYYQNLFWPTINSHKPGTRLYFCDPPGDTRPEAVLNYGADLIMENDYVICHDQEPVYLDLHKPLFDRIDQDVFHINFRANDQGLLHRCDTGHIILSETGQFADQLCDKYNWQQYYYFFHGWACLDWFRGYNLARLIAPAADRRPIKTFMSPNRIIGGRRDHRVLFLYHVFRRGLDNNHISAPRVCPYENQDITTIAHRYCSTYPDIEQVLSQANLPRLFSSETEAVMSSCWLTNFQEASDSLFYVATETAYFGRRQHITEKTFKAIALAMPFVLVAPAHSLEYMRSYGFKTFGDVIDESYDQEINDIMRLEKISQLLTDLNNLSLRERWQIHRHLLPAVQHNYNHFYSGAFEKILWTELQEMLQKLLANLK